MKGEGRQLHFAKTNPIVAYIELLRLGVTRAGFALLDFDQKDQSGFCR